MSMKRLFFVFSLVVLVTGLQAQKIFEPVTWETSYKQVSDNEFDLVFTATIEKNWVIYSQYLPEADVRPIPTGFYFDKGDHYETVGKVKEGGTKKRNTIRFLTWILPSSTKPEFSPKG